MQSAFRQSLDQAKTLEPVETRPSIPTLPTQGSIWQSDVRAYLDFQIRTDLVFRYLAVERNSTLLFCFIHSAFKIRWGKLFFFFEDLRWFRFLDPHHHEIYPNAKAPSDQIFLHRLTFIGTLCGWAIRCVAMTEAAMGPTSEDLYKPQLWLFNSCRI